MIYNNTMDHRTQFKNEEEKRIDIPRPFDDNSLISIQLPIGETWQAPLNGKPGWCCRVVLPDEFLLAQGGLRQKELAHRVLSPREQETWRKFQGGAVRRRLDWLRGRLAAKDTVRGLAESRYNLALQPADVEIIAEGNGRPLVDGSWMVQIDEPIILSIAHSHEMAVAIARFVEKGTRTQGIGIDLEWVDARHDQRLLLVESEQRLLADKNSQPEDAWSLRLWCAKEAVGKSFGVGLAARMDQIIATDFDYPTGMVQVSLSGKMAEKFPQYKPPIDVYTQRDGDYVVASVI